MDKAARMLKDALTLIVEAMAEIKEKEREREEKPAPVLHLVRGPDEAEAD